MRRSACSCTHPGCPVSFDDAFRRGVDPTTGGWIATLETVTRRISALAGKDSVSWVGITSSGADGCRARWNAKYKGLGMKHMAAVYSSASHSFVSNMEAELVKHYGHCVDNAIGGGGGAIGEPPYVVYAVWE